MTEGLEVFRRAKLPDGQYEGSWGGYRVELVLDGEEYFIKTANGIRGLKVPCCVTVKEGKVTVEAHRRKSRL